MEIPVINRIGDFEAGITSLQNPSFLSQAFALSGIERIHQAYGFWKWGAFILALVASFTTIINRVKILIIHFRNQSLKASQSLLDLDDSDYDSESDLSTSSLSGSDDEEEEEEEDDNDDPSTSSRSWRAVDEDFRVRGSGHYIDDQWQNGKFTLRRRRSNSIGDLFSWSELANGGVVKLWDNLGLGIQLDLDLDGEPRNIVSVYDEDSEQDMYSIFGGNSEAQAGISASSSAPAVRVSAERNGEGSVLRVWDARTGFRIPAILAEWRPVLGKIVGVRAIGGGADVYVRDDVTADGRFTVVGDMRKAGSPLVNVTESDVDTWWDADAFVVTEEEQVDESGGRCDD